MATFDQRGAPFVRVFDGDGTSGARIDIGAFELQPNVSPALPGNYNHNGVVDFADYVMWRNTLHANVAPYSGADGSGNAVVDQADYDMWKSNFGQTLPPPAAGAIFAAGSTKIEPRLQAAEPMAPHVDSVPVEERAGSVSAVASPRDAALAALSPHMQIFARPRQTGIARRTLVPSMLPVVTDQPLITRVAIPRVNQHSPGLAKNFEWCDEPTIEVMESFGDALDAALASLT